VRAKQAGQFSLFNCPGHTQVITKTSQHPWVKNYNRLQKRKTMDMAQGRTDSIFVKFGCKWTYSLMNKILI
jgi:hypothetical protein